MIPAALALALALLVLGLLQVLFYVLGLAPATAYFSAAVSAGALYLWLSLGRSERS